MKLTQTPLEGVFVVTLEKMEDERGFFVRSFCEQVFSEHHIPFHTAQCNISFNKSQGTLRGMHFQRSPKAEAKLVRCTQGRIFDVAVDLRPQSASYCKWFGLELNAMNYNGLFIPEGCAHGFLTLTDNSEVFYHMGEFYAPELADGVRWDDPTFGIQWPFPPKIISPRDDQWPEFSP